MCIVSAMIARSGLMRPFVFGGRRCLWLVCVCHVVPWHMRLSRVLVSSDVWRACCIWLGGCGVGWGFPVQPDPAGTGVGVVCVEQVL